MSVVEAAYEYSEELGKRYGYQASVTGPLARLEVDIAIVDFIRYMQPAMVHAQPAIIDSGWRLRADPIDADNGNWTIPLHYPSEARYGKRSVRSDV
jgi:hypothetical protein